AAVKAHTRGVPLVALKTGSSELGAQVTVSHTSSLAGRDVLYDALFARLGIPRVRDLAGLLEALKFLSVHNGLRGNRVASASCSATTAAPPTTGPPLWRRWSGRAGPPAPPPRWSARCPRAFRRPWESVCSARASPRCRAWRTASTPYGLRRRSARPTRGTSRN